MTDAGDDIGCGARATGPLPAPLPVTVPPDPAALLASLSAMLDDGDLRIIAECDYGRDVPEHFAALRGIARAGTIPRPLAWAPREALELTRWDQPPADVTAEPRLWRHAFACCALVRAYGDAESQAVLVGQNQSLIGLIDGLRTLAGLPLPRARRAAAQAADGRGAALLAWLIPRLPPGEEGETAFFALGLLWFALACDVPDAALLALSEWVMRAEDAAAAPWRDEWGALKPRPWLLGTSYHAQRHAAWRALGSALPGRLRRRHGAEVVEAVRLIGAMLTP